MKVQETACREEELLYRVALTMIPGIGAITAKKLIAYLGSPEAIFLEPASNLGKIPGIGPYLSGKIRLDHILKKAETELRAMERLGISWTYYRDPDYPWRLKNCDDGPLLLFYRGDLDLNRTKFLSVVGTRSATRYGKETCEAIIRDLVEKHPDLVVVSGLAYGIDIIAHRSALKSGIDTVAVLAHGLNTIYPPAHYETARKIAGQGSLVTDFHSGIKPERSNFLRRNRIIAGLSDGTLVVESGIKGGALITAEMSASYNREVFAVPGRITDRYSAGCNDLVKRNIAAMAETAGDIEYLLNWMPEETEPAATRQLTEMITADEKGILEVLADSPGIGSEFISIRTGIPLQRVMALLVQMELKKWISMGPGNTYRASVLPG